MTPSDLQTCREWCRANGVSVELVDDGDKGDVMYHLRGRQRWMGDEFDFWYQTEQEVYAALWRRLHPWLQSVRNLDAVEVEGPYRAQPWKVREGVQYYCVTNSMSFDFFADMSEQTARRIAAILNRECWDGK